MAGLQGERGDSQETPDKVLELPVGSQASNLEDKKTVIVEKLVDFAEESAVATDTDVLSHLEARDLVVVALLVGDVAVVHAENAALSLRDTVLTETLVTESSLSLGKSDTSNVRTVILGSVGYQSSPSTANVEHAVTRLQVQLLADSVQLVVLELLKSLLAVDVGDDTTGVDHTGSKEPSVKVVTAVVVVTNLVLVLGLRVENDIGNEVGEDVFEELGLMTCPMTVTAGAYLGGELERSPIVAVFHDIQNVALEVDFSVKVSVVELLHGELAPRGDKLTERRVLQVDIVLDRLAGEGNLFVDTPAVSRGEHPVTNGERDKKDGDENKVGRPSGLEGDEPLNNPWHSQVEGSQVEVVEGSRALCWEGRIGNGWVRGAAVSHYCARTLVTYVVYPLPSSLLILASSEPTAAMVIAKVSGV